MCHTKVFYIIIAHIVLKNLCWIQNYIHGPRCAWRMTRTSLSTYDSYFLVFHMLFIVFPPIYPEEKCIYHMTPVLFSDVTSCTKKVLYDRTLHNASSLARYLMTPSLPTSCFLLKLVHHSKRSISFQNSHLIYRILQS